MNSLMAEHGPILEQTLALRHQLMEILTDEDLGYSPGGDNPTLGALCREMGEVQQSYVTSFQTFEQEFRHREQPELEGSVERLTAWFNRLDREFKETLESLSEEDLQNRVIDRGGGFVIPPTIQYHIYREALLIFFAKASVYLKGLGKALPEQWQAWIA
ncbi:MAG: DinB family protein [Anaerolineae bacterium]|jgi:hypothetical protein